MIRRVATVGWMGATMAVALIGWFAGQANAPKLAAQNPADEPKPAIAAPGTDAALRAELNVQYERFRLVDDTFALVARSVTPSLVHIVARKSGERDDGTPARFEESGSGVIVTADADKGVGRYVLTNNHVVTGAAAAEVSITLQDGRVLEPDRVWTDAKLDIAVLRLNRTDLPAAPLGDSDQAAVGHWVLAFGSPFGLTHSVSQGIISARSRYEPQLERDGVENQDFLQTDAAINPGNSGGPLVNMRGEVIGINTAIASNGGGNEGVGFSIPVNLARWALNQLITHGHVSRGAIGVRLQDLSTRLARDLGLDRPRGARVDWVQPETPAAIAGLRRGDVILRFNGSDVLDYNHLITMVSTTPVGQSVPVVVWRDGKAIDARVVVADRDQILAVQGNAPAQPGPDGLIGRPRATPTAPADGWGAGLALSAIDSAETARKHGWSETARGVRVDAVDDGALLGGVLEVGDLLEAIDGKPVRTMDDARLTLRVMTAHSLHFQRIENGTAKSRIVQIEAP